MEPCYIKYLGKVNRGICSIDHLKRVQQKNNELWRFSRKEDLCKVDLAQIIGLKPGYEWDVQNIHTLKMELKNHRAIDEAVKQAQLN